MQSLESVVRASTRALNADILKAHLATLTLDEQAIEDLLGLLLRTELFVLKHRNDKSREPGRKAFLDEITAFVASSSPGAEHYFANALKAFGWIDFGYDVIEEMAQANGLMLEPLATRISATLVGAMEECQVVFDAMASSHGDTTYVDHNTPIQTRSDGPRVFADSALSSVFRGLTSALMREGYVEKLWNADGVFRCPKLIETTPHQNDCGRGRIVGAIYWQRWEHFEQRVRYHRGNLESIPREQWPEDAPDNAEVFLRYTPTVNEAILMTHCTAGGERLRARLFQDSMWLLEKVAPEKKLTDVQSSPPLPDKAFVSLEEFVAYESLCYLLAIDLSTHAREFKGLRAIDWLRGYSALKSLAQQHALGASDATAYLIEIRHDDLLTYLENAGLEHTKAAAFIVAALFSRFSKDLWDCPLLEIDGGGADKNYLFVSPLARSGNLVLTVLSAVAKDKDFFKAKGTGLEKAVHDVLLKSGLKPEAVHFKRDGEEFEIDVLFELDDAVVLIECKNRSVPADEPIDLFYFKLELDANSKQVSRHINGLKRYPEELVAALGATAASKPFVPIIVYSLPFSLSGSEGTPTYLDFNSFRRFFLGRDLSVRQFMKQPNGTVITITPLYKMWAGDRATLADFRRYLLDLPQLRAALSHVELAEIETLNGGGLLAVGPTIHLRQATTNSMAQALSDEPEQALLEIANAANELHAMSARLNDELIEDGPSF